MAGYYGSLSTLQTLNLTFGQHYDATISPENASISTEYVSLQQQSFWQNDVSNVLRKGFPPVIMMLGTFGNVMTVLVMRAMKGQAADPSMCVYFPSLAVCDQVVLISGLGRLWIRSVFLYDIRNAHVVVCKLHKFLVFAISGNSTYILVAVTSQRVMTVMWPLRQRLSSTRKRAMVVVGVIAVVNCLQDSGFLVMYTLQWSELSGLAECSVVLDTPAAVIYENHVFPWLNILTRSMVPFVILVVNNVILAFKVRQSAIASRHMTGGDAQKNEAAPDARRSKQATSLSLTLIAVSLTFMLLTSSIPASFFLRRFYLSELGSDGQHLDHAEVQQIRADFGLGNAVLDLMWYCNSAVNFYLYFLTGPTFRQEARRLLCCWRRKD